jgi:hypothetical protein
LPEEQRLQAWPGFDGHLETQLSHRAVESFYGEDIQAFGYAFSPRGGGHVRRCRARAT